MKRALTADGWTVTHDPFRIAFGVRELFVNLGIRGNTLAADRAGRKIAVEIQSFIGRSAMRDLQQAIGQYLMYRIVMQESYPERELFLAVPQEFFAEALSDDFGRLIGAKVPLRIVVFDSNTERINQWIG